MEKIIITKDEVGKRIDKFLAKEFFLYSRGEIGRMIDRNEISVNSKKIKSSYILKLDDVVEISTPIELPNSLLPNATIKIPIIFENTQFVVIDKPAGLQVHPSAIEKNNTVANWFLAHYPQSADVHDNSPEGYLRPGIVHRLDKETSGLMIMAKDRESFLQLKKLFSQRRMSKKYIALVHGIVKNNSGTIDAPISRSSSHKKQVASARKMTGKIREAITQYEIVKQYKKFTLIEAHPLTGRMHQIRVHCAHIGHPVVGDRKYANKKLYKKDGSLRHLLHAQDLSFELSGKKYSFKAPLPADFAAFLANID
jgi:23S rRNA pseudouridine1911/1915/1917 synthase